MKNLYIFTTFFGLTCIKGTYIPQELQVRKALPTRLLTGQVKPVNQTRIKAVFLMNGSCI